MGSAHSISAGGTHTCALLSTNRVRCWGHGERGRLGYASTEDVGDDELPSSIGDVDTGDDVTQVVTGFGHTCALLTTGAVRCWGTGVSGQLGQGDCIDLDGSSHECDIGDDELPGSVSAIDIGGTVTQIVAAASRTCALLDTGGVRCWGYGLDRTLGYTRLGNIGDNETPAVVGDIEVGGAAAQIASGHDHSCALLGAGQVRCWGDGRFGKLGNLDTVTIGDNETPASAGDVDVGGTVVQIVAGGHHTCALLDSGAVRCWGNGSLGQLGYGGAHGYQSAGQPNNIGDGETPASAGDVDVGGTVVQITAGGDHTCALLTTGRIRCWGRNGDGELGYGNQDTVGDNETPSVAGDVNIGGLATQVTAGVAHTCARMSTGSVKCWGKGFYGRLGYGDQEAIGDNEEPISVGAVPLF
ncbi:MAG: hypothetical protein GY811_01935 [Myxococcales bacterium]|nr:hypothetical protein [Myxococcales bacterium]